MAFEITLPRQGWSMDEATFVQWLKADGDQVQAGEPLFSVETDKAVQEIESLDDGLLHTLTNGPSPGDVVRVGDVIGYLLEPGEEPPDAAAAPRGDTEQEPTQTSQPAPDSASAVPLPDATGQAGAAPIAPIAPPQVASAVTPRAARRALQDGVDLRTVIGSGAAGRIRERDVAAAASSAPASFQPVSPSPVLPPPAATPASGRHVPISGLRRTIAQRMHLSSSATAPVTLTTQADASALVSLREQLKATATADEPAPSLTDILVALVGQALQDFPMLRARWSDTHLVVPEAVHIGLAVDTDDGLLVPVVHDVPGLSLRQLAARTRDLVARARRRQLTAAELSDGTFTITNLGALGVDAFTPIINYPECAVLGVGRIRRVPAVVDHQIVIRDQLWLSLTFDHRVVDGAPAARFLDTVRQAVECAAAHLIG